MLIIIATAIAYFLGSVNCAILVCRHYQSIDPRALGSSNPGATNVLRIAGKKAAFITLIGDLLKGLIAVMIGQLLGIEGFWLGVVALGVFIGHLYPIFFKFQGGKGLATLLGTALGLNLLVGIAAIVTWLIIALACRYSSLAAMGSGILLPIYILIFAHPYYFLPTLVMAVLLLYRHQTNLQRLRAGKEQKIDIR